MKNSFKKCIITCIAILVVLGILVSCSSKKTSQSQEEKPAENGKTEEQSEQKPVEEELDPMVTPAGTFPIAKEKVTLKVMASHLPQVADFIENDFTKWFEEQTNVHIEWELVPSGEASTKLNLALAGNTLPDVFMMPWTMSTSQIALYGQQGMFLGLNKYIEKYGINFKKVLQQYPLLEDIIRMPDGEIYVVPNVDDAFHTYYPDKMWVYKPWLDKLGLKIPTTTQEFYEMLKAFKGKDLNGNGKIDEIPFAGTGMSGLDPFIMNAFVYSDPTNKWITLNNGKVEVAYIKEGWKEGILYLRKLYKEGLIAQDIFTLDNKSFRQLNEGEIKIGVFCQLAPWRSLSTDYSDQRWVDYKAVPPLKGPNGLQVAHYLPYNIGWFDGYIITKDCKYPAVAFRLGDAMLNQDPEFVLRKYYGRPDQEWRWAKQGEIGLNGQPAIWASLAKSGGEIDPPTTHSWTHLGPHVRSAEFREGQAVLRDDPQKDPSFVLHHVTKEYYAPYAPNINIILKPLVFTESQAQELGDLEKVITDYVKEMFTAFVTGDKDIEKEWDSYIKQLNDMGLERYLQIYQEAYDRKYKK